VKRSPRVPGLTIERITAEGARKTSVDDLFTRLRSGERGLSTPEAEKRRQEYGFNEIPEKRRSPVVTFFTYFWGPIPWMIEFALILSAFIGKWDDFSVILILLVFNAIVGFWQEYKADTAIALLKKRLALNARVFRDGGWVTLEARELVPGDLIRVRLGDIVPADIKLAGTGYLSVDESTLTGESLPVTKNPSDIAYSASVIRQGETEGLVYATGRDTFFGKTTGLVAEAKGMSHFQKAVIRIGDYLIALAIALAVVIFVVAFLRQEGLIETLQFVLVLTVAAIPVALPAVLTTTMAVGAIALAKKEAIVSKLVAIEELAGVDILCVDKTGTITKNELTVAEVVPLGDATERDVFLLARLASREEDGDPIDGAILARTREIEDLSRSLASFRVTGFKPFDPVGKRTEALVVDASGSRFTAAKGAPQVILSLAGEESTVRPDVERTVNAFAARGFRAIGVARRDIDGIWQFTGLLALYDPPQDDSAETIDTARGMGISVRMLTGDHVAIAREIADRVHLGHNIVSASSLKGISRDECARVIETSDGLAEVFPEHKFRIVEALQKHDHIVGMTGDGVNDAPALKKANAGIAVAGATDAAKSAADIVLTRSGIAVIIDAIRESRKIFQRMNNYAIYRISETIRILFFITASIVAFNLYPVTALMIVLLALLNDFSIMTIAFDNVLPSEKPVRWQMRKLLAMSTILGIFGVFSSFGLLYIGVEILHLSPEILQSFIYLKLSVAGHLLVFVARTKGPFWSVKPALPLFLAVVLTQLTATLITVYGIILPAMGWGLALFVWAYALVMFLITDFIKIQAYRILDHPEIIGLR
jgi:H+-transporting ATPase